MEWTPEQTEIMRRNVGDALGRSEGTLFRYADGPLQGLPVRLDLASINYLHGWCCQDTQWGLLVAHYRADAKRRMCFFDGYGTTGWEEPGLAG